MCQVARVNGRSINEEAKGGEQGIAGDAPTTKQPRVEHGDIVARG